MDVTRRFAGFDDMDLLFEINRSAHKDHVRANFGAWDDEYQRRSFWQKTDPSAHL